MKLNYFLILYIFIFLKFYFGNGYIQTLENSCLSQLLNRSGQINNFPYSSPDDLCTKYDYEFGCISGYVTKIYLSNYLTSYQFEPSDFSCFKNAIDLDLIGGNITSNFFSNVSLINLSSFSMISTPASYTGILNFSSLTKFTNFKFYGENINLIYYNDLTNFNYWNRIEISSNNVPNASFINTTQFVFYPSIWFDQNSYENFTTFSYVSILSFDGSYSKGKLLDFPIQLLDKSSIKYAYALIFDTINFTKPIDFLDFSKQTVSGLYFSSIPSTFSIDGKIPLMNTNSSKFCYYYSSGLTDYSNLADLTKNSKIVYLNSNGLTNNMDQFIPMVNGVLQNLVLSNNKIVGTLNEKFCNLQNLDINSNLINGTIPSCFSCHLGPNLKNSGIYSNMISKFKNYTYPTTPCKTIIPNLRFDYSQNRTYLFGKDLGFLDTYFQTTPKATWYIDVPSESFYKKGTEINTFDVFFRFPGLNFHVTASPNQPQIDNVYVENNGNLIINGSDFSYNTTIIKIDSIDNQYSCLVYNATFYQLFCTVPDFNSETYIIDSKTQITVGNLSTEVNITLIPDFLNQYLNCSEACTGNSFCYRNSGTCICDCNYDNLEACNIKTRSCYKQCSNNCSNNGICNNGVCQCDEGYFGQVCKYQQHYVSSIEHSITSNNPNGGIVTLVGSFTNYHDNLTVSIGELNCLVNLVNGTTIICNLESGDTGIKSTKVNQNNLSWSLSNSFEYLNSIKNCLNNCTSLNNGICNSSTGLCKCSNGYKGFDCSSLDSLGSNNGQSSEETNILPPSKPNINDNTGSSSISNQEVLYDIFITKLVEYDINQNQVLSFDLENKWLFDNQSSTNDLSVFKQILNDEKNSTIISKLEIVNKDREVNFAGIDFKIESGSIKISVEVLNYNYKNNLNTIQIQFKSNVTEYKDKENNCNHKNTEIQIENQPSTINYINIKKNGKIMYGRIINYVLSDNRPTLISSSIVSQDSDSITIGLNLPHCKSSCIIDPDFSVLIQSFEPSCSNGRPSYIIPVSVTLSILVVAAIGTALVFFIKKKKYNIIIQMKSLQSKLKKVNN